MKPTCMEKPLTDILREAFDTDQAIERDDLRLMDLEGWDSMAHMNFVLKLEEVYGIELTGDEIVDMQTIGDIKAVLEKRNVHAP